MTTVSAEASGLHPDRYPFRRTETVRFNDCDPLGHVNNATFSTYLEEARIDILRDFNGFILARVEIDFRSQLAVGEEVTIESRCSSVGNTSFALEHRVLASGRLVAEAMSVMVSYDYAAGESVPVPSAVVARLMPPSL